MTGRPKPGRLAPGPARLLAAGGLVLLAGAIVPHAFDGQRWLAVAVAAVPPVAYLVAALIVPSGTGRLRRTGGPIAGAMLFGGLAAGLYLPALVLVDPWLDPGHAWMVPIVWAHHLLEPLTEAIVVLSHADGDGPAMMTVMVVEPPLAGAVLAGLAAWAVRCLRRSR